MTSAVSVTVLLLFTAKEASGNMPGAPFSSLKRIFLPSGSASCRWQTFFRQITDSRRDVLSSLIPGNIVGK
jgi:hypothetical protein